MSLNKFFDTDVGQSINLNVGADNVKCNLLEAQQAIIDVLIPSNIDSLYILQAYNATIIATEGAVLSNLKPVRQLKIGEYVEITTTMSIATPSNSCESFDILIEKSSLIKSLGANIAQIYREIHGVSFGVGSSDFRYNIVEEICDITNDPNYYVLTMKKSDSTTFTQSTNMFCSVLIKLVLL